MIGNVFLDYNPLAVNFDKQTSNNWGRAPMWFSSLIDSVCISISWAVWGKHCWTGHIFERRCAKNVILFLFFLYLTSELVNKYLWWTVFADLNTEHFLLREQSVIFFFLDFINLLYCNFSCICRWQKSLLIFILTMLEHCCKLKEGKDVFVVFNKQCFWET